MDLPEVRESARLEAAFPPGDGELLHRLQQSCEDVGTRPLELMCPHFGPVTEVSQEIADLLCVRGSSRCAVIPRMCR